MELRLKTVVGGIGIYLTLDEALEVCTNDDARDKLQREIGSMLNGAGVDPDSGERKDVNVLGHHVPEPKAPLPGKKQEIPAPEPCPHCDRKFKGSRGVKMHLAHGCPEAPEENEGGEDESGDADDWFERSGYAEGAEDESS